jgi:methylmalonyl-CoA mutase C-terminal domain/subunit
MTDHRPRGVIRVLVAKPGLDGHDVGAKLVCRALMEAGMEVIYTGLRQSPSKIAAAALQEAVDVVGLSILSGAHLALSRAVAGELSARGLGDLPLLVGGNIPKRDLAALREIGVAGVFPTGTPFERVVAFLHGRFPAAATAAS